MNIVAAVFADFEASFLGGPSQLDTKIGSRSILAHTLARVARIEGVQQRCLFVRARDRERAERAVTAAGLADTVELLALDSGARPRRSLVRSARKWNLDAWRGSPLGTTWFDEYVEPLEVARVLDHYGAEAALCFDGCQPALDVGIAERMIAHQLEHEAEAELVFTQAPPGLAGILLRRSVIGKLLQAQAPVGMVLAYRPESPRMDLISKEFCYRIGRRVAQLAARFTGDTLWSRDVLNAAFAALGEDCAAGQLCDWFRASGRERGACLPVELELELSTQDPLPETTVRPRGGRVPNRQLGDIGAVTQICEQLAAYDDRLLVFAGHGDPLSHPSFAKACRAARGAGVCGIAVVTSLAELSAEDLEAFFDAKVDVVQVRIDANTAETYRRVHQADHFDAVLANIERIEQRRSELQSPQPIVLCSLTRCALTLHEVEPFFDRWTDSSGWALIEGYRRFGNTLAEDPLPQMTPLVREPCRRLARRMMLLADGRAVLCNEDPCGGQTIGSWLESDLAALWSGPAIESARQAQNQLRLNTYSVCSICREWSRP